jgi:HPr kinase/phosphorylase
MIQQLSLIGISAQLIFDENFDDLKLHWVAGQRGI